MRLNIFTADAKEAALACQRIQVPGQHRLRGRESAQNARGPRPKHI